MKNEYEEGEVIVRFLSNQQIDSKKKKLKKGKRVFYDKRFINKCSVALPKIQSLEEIKAIGKSIINNGNSKLKAFAELSCNYILEQGQKIEHKPDENFGFDSHANIVYSDFELAENEHINPDFALLLEKLQKKAKVACV